MKKLLPILLLILALNTAKATTYYVSATGNDANNGTSTLTPFRTTQKAFSVVANGDVVLTKSGDIIPGAGTITKTITVSTYGTGAHPVLSGFNTLSTWTNIGGGIYTCTDATLGATVTMLTINGVQQEMGRFPKATYRTYTAGTLTTLTDASLPNLPSFVSAGGMQTEVVFKGAHYLINKGIVTGQTGGTITYTAEAGNGGTPTAGFGYFFRNNLNCLTAFGDWAYNATTHTVYMYFGANLPGSYTIKASRYANILTLAASNVTITNLVIEGANGYGVVRSGAISNPTLSGCKFRFIGGDAVNITNIAHVTLANDTVSYANNNGFTLTGCNTTTVSAPVIDHVGMIAGAGENGYGSTGWGAYVGIVLGTDDPATSFTNVITNGTITNIGYIGIYINGNTYTVSSNYVDGVCSVKDDGGGIYTYTSTTRTYTGRTISNNIVLHSYGSPQGTTGLNQGSGIYLDDRSAQVTVAGNTVAFCGLYGIFVHNASNNIINLNTVYNNASAQISLVHDNIVATSPLLNNVLTNNNVIAGSNVQLCINLQSIASTSTSTDLTTWGTASNNFYATVFSNANLFLTQLRGSTAIRNTLAGWRGLTLQDNTSSVRFITTATLFLYNTTLAGITSVLSNNYITLNGTAYNAGNLAIAPRSSYFLIYVSTPPTPTAPIMTGRKGIVLP